MFQGFYNLGSEMLCQTRNMNVISNNMANVATAGFKRDDFQVSAFREFSVCRQREGPFIQEMVLLHLMRKDISPYPQ